MFLFQMFLLVIQTIAKRYGIIALVAIAFITGITAISGGSWLTALAIASSVAVVAALITSFVALKKPW